MAKPKVAIIVGTNLLCGLMAMNHHKQEQP
jgi:hypothetical protein